MTEHLIHPGIFFGLPAEAYHRDPALGSSSRKALALDPTEYQFNRLRPPKPDTPALIWGQALHARVLEGRDAMERQFKVRPDPDFAEVPCLITMDDLRRHARDMGISPLPKTKAEAIVLIREHDPDVVIWDEILAKFATDPRIEITSDIAAEIEQAAEWMGADPLIGAVMHDGTFQGGAPEVAIFYEIDGVRLKAKIDYLLPHAIVDLKSYRPKTARTVQAGSLKAIVDFRYDLQAVHYLEAWRAARPLFLAGQVFVMDERIAKGAMLELLRQSFAETPEGSEPIWIWVVLKASGAPQPLVMQWSRKHSPFAMGAADDEIRTALERYKQLSAEFGHLKQWPPRHRAVIIDDATWPPWFGVR